MSVQDELSRETAPQPTPALGPDPLLAHVVYGLYTLGLVSWGAAGLIGVVIAYIKRRDTAGTWLESHYHWQIRTFWIGLLVGVVGGLLTLILIGWLILGGGLVWVVYRIVKGWLRLADRRAVDDVMAMY